MGKYSALCLSRQGPYYSGGSGAPRVQQRDSAEMARSAGDEGMDHRCSPALANFSENSLLFGELAGCRGKSPEFILRKEHFTSPCDPFLAETSGQLLNFS